jgi:putative hemolysin
MSILKAATKGTSQPRQPRSLRAERLTTPDAVREAQALRYAIFSSEFQGQLPGNESGLDQDIFDPHCLHIGVRDLNSGKLVATTRLLEQERAKVLGGFYSEAEFRLNGLKKLKGQVLEIGRTCVDPAYRNGATIALLWAELAELLNEGGYSYLMGCASISMQDGGLQAQAIMQQIREHYLCRDLLQAEPRCPLPEQPLPDNLSIRLPPLLAAYLRLGARVCGEPSVDSAFNSADLLILLKRDQLSSRYARHFKTAV